MTKKRRGRRIKLFASCAVIAALLFSLTSYESYASLYDAEYVGSKVCGECHTLLYAEWQGSPHSLMTRPPTPESVVGDFNDHEWHLPHSGEDSRPAARMRRSGEGYFMDLRNPETGRFFAFPIAFVIGYQYRQTYVYREASGVLRRLPLQWSVKRREFFAYWNLQEKKPATTQDLWDQVTTYTHNSAWNLFCARCHTTHLEILEEDRLHTRGKTRWAEAGIGCEACHGPGSKHADYFATNYVNRIAAFLTSKLRGQPVAYIANPRKLKKGQDTSTCARCHGPDIPLSDTDEYTAYEPGYSKSGKINDLTAYLKKSPLTPGRTTPTIEVWDDGRPKGIGMLLRSFVESKCWNEARVACYDCHDPHSNKRPRRPGLLEAGPVSDAWCLDCHDDLQDRIAEHTHHTPGTAGAHCYDCHMPRSLQNLVGGFTKFTRTHRLSSIPEPARTVEFGPSGAPNACNDCHADEGARWALDWTRKWWPK